MKKIVVIANFLFIVLSCGQTKSSPTKSNSKEELKENSIELNAVDTDIKKSDTLNNLSLSDVLTDTTPIRLLPVGIRNKILPQKHYIGKYELSRRNNGTYYLQNDTSIIRESYPNILLHIKKDYGRLESRIEYYDSNQVLINTIDLRENLPLSIENIKKTTFGLSGEGEFLSTETPYRVSENFKEIADTLLVDIEVALNKASPFRIIDYSIKGIDKNQLIMGFESIVLILNEKGEEIYKGVYGKAISGSFINEDNKFLCLDFSTTNYTNPNAKEGTLLIIDLATGKTLLNYKSIKDEYEGGLSFQEVKRNLLFFNLGPKINKRTNEVFAIRGLLDFNTRRFYKVTLTKDELEKKQKNNPAYFKDIRFEEWTLITEF